MPRIRAGYAGFVAFCAAIGEELEPFERKIAKAHFGAEREVYALLPRGNKKTTLAAKIGLHHLLTVRGASVTIGAASVAQARICFERMRGFAGHRALGGEIVCRHLELRLEDKDKSLRLLRIVPSEGSKAHGLSSTLYVGDELWSWRGDDLLDAFLTGLVKNPKARFVGISTAAAVLDSALGRSRSRALAGDVTRHGSHLDCAAPGMRWLEWSVPEDAHLTDYAEVAKANPAAYITPELLREQASRVTPTAFAQFHANRWGMGEGQWLPPGAWTDCTGDWADEDEPVYLGVDIGGTRAASAIVGVTENLTVAEVHVFQGDGAVLKVVDTILDIAGRRTIVEVAHDPWRFRSEALRLERDHGLSVIEIPMSNARLIAMSEGLHQQIAAGDLTHPGHPTLNQHVANGIAKQTDRGWRLDKSAEGAQIDALIALAMAVERARVAEKPLRVVENIW